MKQMVKVLCLTWALTVATAAASFARDVTLQWASSDPTVTGYKVYYQADSSGPPFNGTGSTLGASPIDVKNVKTATVTGLDPSRAYYFAITAYNASGIESTYSNTVSVAEGVAPTVSITAPAQNATATGTVSVTASASDNVGVTQLEFYVNGALAATDTSTPYLYSWNTSALAAGSYTLMAKAYDAAGNVGQSANVTVSVVKDTTAPTVTVTAPASNATVSGTTALAATATDNIGVAKVEFYANGALLTATNVAPYSYNWNTATVANGSYTITAKAYDAAGNVGQSSNVAVNVNNTVADTTKPVVSITSPASGATVSGTASIATTATDNVGVSKVEFYVNGALQATDTASPYTFSWNTTAVANGSYTLSAKAYDAAGNVGQSANTSVTVQNTVPVSAGAVTAVFGNASGSTYTNTVQDTFLNINTDVNATASTLYGYTWPAAKPANAILMTWDLSALPSGAQIQSATLSLYMTGSGGDALYEMPVSAIINKSPVVAKSTGATYDGVNAWTPSSIPYGGVPLAQSDMAPAADLPQVDQAIGYKNWNVTSIIKGWIANPSSNRGVLIDSSSKATADSYRAFASSEVADATQRPKLTITYTVASSDTTAPTAAITAPAASSTVSGTVTASVTASDNVGVSKVEFYVDGTLQATDTASPYTFSWNTGTQANGAHTLTAKAYDAAGNVGQSSAVTVTVSNAATTTSSTLWSASTVPATIDAGPDGSIELGMKFKSDVSGYITGIRFYKASTNTGTHTASLWTSTGSRLATATFTSETGSGWQQVNFTNPVSISANTVYVASYHSTTGHFSVDRNYFNGKGFDAAPLHALASGVSGANGVYVYSSSSTFPNQSYQYSNYWVDVVFSR